MNWLHPFIFILLIIISSCTNNVFNDINDEAKRNDKWVWWVADSTGIGKWIPYGDRTTIQNGCFTMFYFNGNIAAKGKMKNGITIDTTLLYDTAGNLYGYALGDSIAQRILTRYFYQDGEHKLYDVNGKITAVGIVQNHKVGDTFMTYWGNGEICYQRNLVNGKGYSMSYFENGQIKAVKYYGLDSTSLDRVRTVKEWYENGSPLIESNITDGKCDGDFKKYNETGKVIATWEIKNGLRNGVANTFYNNGNNRTTGFYTNGKINGVIKEWYDNGQLRGVMSISNGIPNGVCIGYYANGKIKDIGSYKNGFLNGVGTDYDSTGKIIGQKTFKMEKAFPDSIYEKNFSNLTLFSESTATNE